MPDAQANDGISALREPLRRIDSVLNFARKLARESGGVPPGLVADFSEARKELEKAFVFHYDAVDHNMQKLLREFLQLTKGLTAAQIAEHCDRAGSGRAGPQVVRHARAAPGPGGRRVDRRAGRRRGGGRVPAWPLVRHSAAAGHEQRHCGQPVGAEKRALG